MTTTSLEKTYTLINKDDIINSLKNLSQEFKGKIVFSTSFSYEDQIISHLILKNKIPIEIFTLDTGRLFKETQEVLNKTNSKYQTKIKIYFPDYQAVEKMVNKKGNYSFYHSIDNRKECCFIRKVQPLQRAIKGMDLWITGIRAEQGTTRNDLPQLEWDEKNQIIKYHPLLYWSLEEVENFVKENNVPYNKLHDKGFPSIGCEPCTRAIQEGEDIRAGRWWWENPDLKECGLHK